MLPTTLAATLAAHVAKVRELHTSDLEKGYGSVYLPNALARKYSPSPQPSPARGEGASKEWGWQYVFPSGKLSLV